MSNYLFLVMTRNIKRLFFIATALPYFITGCLPRVNLDAAILHNAALMANTITQEGLYALLNNVVDGHKNDFSPDDFYQHIYPGEPIMENYTHKEVRQTILKTLEKMGVYPMEQANTSTRSLLNIVSEIEGDTYPDEVVQVSAHYDAFYAAADDNSSGVAALLAIAQAAKKQHFARTLRFVFFDYEEVGFLGSSYFVKKLPYQETLYANLVFDCIGYYSDRSFSQRGIIGIFAPTTGNFLAVVANEDSKKLAAEFEEMQHQKKFLPLFTLTVPGNGIHWLTSFLQRSDHVPFWEKRLPTLLLTDTGDLRNPHYHEPSDLPETIHLPLYTQAVRLSATALAYWANAPKEEKAASNSTK